MSELNLIGTTLGRFEILRELGRGGMAMVYQARQTDLERIVALKVLPPALTHDASYVARFRQEARSAARLEHPHIMPIYEVGESGGLHYIAMKYIPGQTVKDLLQAEGALSVQRAAGILAQVGEALDHAHRQGVIHRDIKPSNMMVTEEGWVFLTDFGLARGLGGGTAGLTMAGTVMGTPEYMSPEQAQGLDSVGPPTDIYALGVVLYELLTGTFPFRADTPMAMLAARLIQAPIPPRDVRGDLPPAVEDVVMRALARKPEARYQSAAAMVAALRAAAGIGSAEPPRPATPIGGVPAVGATIKAPALGPAQTPGAGAPYVQRPAHAPTQLASLPPASPAPIPGPTALPPQGVAAQGQPAAPRRKSNTLAIIIGALGAALLACIGLFAVSALTGGDDPEPVVTTTVAELDGRLAELDALLAEEDGLSQAIDGYDELAAANPGDPRPLARLAMAYNASGDWDRAEEYANQLIDAPASDGSQVALGYALLADAYASQGNITGALGEVDKAIENDEGLALGHAIESNLLASRAVAIGDTAEMDAALASLDRAVDSLDDEEPFAKALTHNALAYTFGQEQELSGSEAFLAQSEEQYQAAIELLPGAGLFDANLGWLMVGQEEYDAARESFEAAIEKGYPAAHAGLGWSAYYEGDTEAAEEAFDQAIDEAPDQPDGYFGKGRLRYDEQDYDGAIDLFSQAVAQNEQSPELQSWLGEALFWKGFNGEDDEATAAFEQAIAAYKAALAANDRYTFAASGLGWTYQHLEVYDESVAAFDRAIELDPHTAANYNGKGWSLYNAGSLEEAEAAFRQALERDEDYADAHYNLGRTLEDLGRVDEARAAYEQALSLDPENSEIQERLASLES